MLFIFERIYALKVSEVERKKKMAQYQHLPLYKTTYNLLLELMIVTKNFPREYKYSVAEKIQNVILEVLLDIYKANNAKDKKVFLLDLLEKVQLINVMLRISFDLKIITEEKYAHFVEQTYSVSKQAQGWLNSLPVESNT